MRDLGTDTPPSPDPLPQARRARWWLWLLLGASVIAMLVMAELSPEVVAWMRANWQFFRLPMMHIENLELCTGLNIQHIVIFGWIGLLLRLAWPTPRWGWPWLLILSLGIFIELAQFLSPGRTPKVTDIRDDLLGAGLGWCAGGMVLGIARWIVARPRRRASVDAGGKETPGQSHSDRL